MMKEAPATNSNPSGKPSTNVNENSLTPSNNIVITTQSTLIVTYSPIIHVDTLATITLVLSNSSTLTNIVTVDGMSTSGGVAFLGDFSQTNMYVGSIYYDEFDIYAAIPPRMIVNMSLTGITASDTSSSTITYNIIANATGNTLTLSSGSDYLFIVFPTSFQ